MLLCEEISAQSNNKHYVTDAIFLSSGRIPFFHGAYASPSQLFYAVFVSAALCHARELSVKGVHCADGGADDDGVGAE